MSTDLAPNSRIEHRLRSTFDAVIPYLSIDDNDLDQWEDEVDVRSALIGGRQAALTRRPVLLSIAAATLLVVGGAAVWSATNRSTPSFEPAAPVETPETSVAATTSATTSLATPPTSTGTTSAEVSATTLSAAPPTSTPMCVSDGCVPLDRLVVVDGAFDILVGPESLGTRVVHQEWIDQVGLVRCLELTPDGTACRRIEGLAAVALVSYPLVSVDIGTTYTSVSHADYAARWVSDAEPARTQDVTVRGRSGVRSSTNGREFVVWQERDGVLAWVTVESTMADQLLTIAEGVRTIDGPETMAHLVVTSLGEPWDAEDNDADGVVYGRVGGALCLGIGWLPDQCSKIVTRRGPDRPGILSVAGAGPIEATSARIDVAGSPPQTFATIVDVGLLDARLFLAEIPDGVDQFTLTWLSSDGSDIAGEVFVVAETDAGAYSEAGAYVVEPAVPSKATTASDQATLLIANASTVNGVAGMLTVELSQDYNTVTATNALTQRERTVVYYAAGFEPAAIELAERIGGAEIRPMPDLDTVVEADPTLVVDLVVMLGQDHARAVESTS
jgi:LytR cell envelope-related transcriptional attenuator